MISRLLMAFAMMVLGLSYLHMLEGTDFALNSGGFAGRNVLGLAEPDSDHIEPISDQARLWWQPEERFIRTQRSYRLPGESAIIVDWITIDTLGATAWTHSTSDGTSTQKGIKFPNGDPADREVGKLLNIVILLSDAEINSTTPPKRKIRIVSAEERIPSDAPTSGRKNDRSTGSNSLKSWRALGNTETWPTIEIKEVP